MVGRTTIRSGSKRSNKKDKTYSDLYTYFFCIKKTDEISIAHNEKSGLEKFDTHRIF